MGGERASRRAPRDGLRVAVAALAAGAFGLGGCDAIGRLGEMVGLGGDKPAPAASPAPRPRAPVPQAPASAGAPTAAPTAGPATPRAATPAPAGTPVPQAAARPPAAQPPASPPAGATAAAQAPASSAPGTPNAAAAPASANPAAPAASPGGAVPSAPRMPGSENAYDPTGKRDPFKPYVTAAALAQQRSRQPLAPLQRLELSQIRLVAIAWGLRSNYAMVEDPGGTGYVLRVGTRVGPNGGRVSRITPEAVYVDESSRDAAGAVLTNQIILRLPVRAGGKGS